MQYIYYLEESQTWVCPKSGRWKVICVGGGSSGTFGYSNGSDDGWMYPVYGESTSFGNYLSAVGGEAITAFNVYSKPDIANGIGGYDLFQYGGAGSDRLGGHDGTAGYGYGAGGGAKKAKVRYTGSSSGILTIYPVSGECGGIRTGTFDLNINESIICTVGKSNIINEDDFTNSALTLANLIYSGSTISKITEPFSSYTPGHDGVIILQYLGE